MAKRKKTKKKPSENPRQTKESPKNFYANDATRCRAIIYNGTDRCKHKIVGNNLCKIHNKLQLKKQKMHENFVSKKGGMPPKQRPATSIYEYDYYLDKDVEHFDSNAVKVVPGIWLGSIDSAHDVDFLQQNRIKSIINISGMEPNPKTQDMYNKLKIDYYTLSKIEKVPNKSHLRVTRYLGDEKFRKKRFTPKTFFRYIQKGCDIMNRKSFKFPVLIHCHAGINRSASLILAYLITKPHPYTFDRAIKLLKQANAKRGLDVLTNRDFVRALRYFPIYNGTKKSIPPHTLTGYKKMMTYYT